jgi:hypothetical protein
MKDDSYNYKVQSNKPNLSGMKYSLLILSTIFILSSGYIVYSIVDALKPTNTKFVNTTDENYISPYSYQYGKSQSTAIEDSDIEENPEEIILDDVDSEIEELEKTLRELEL